VIGENITQRSLIPRDPVFTGFFDQDHRAIDEGIALYFADLHPLLVKM